VPKTIKYALQQIISAVVGVRAEGFVAGQSPTTWLPLSAVVGVRAEGFVAGRSPTTLFPLSAVVGVRAEGFVAEQSPTTWLTCYIQPLLVFVQRASWQSNHQQL